MKNLIVSAAVVALATSAASAQQAVQWRVEDGGNGHWYAKIQMDEVVSWSTAKLEAEARGGRLSCHETPAENQFVWQSAVQPTLQGWDAWIGLRKVGAQWTWLTGPTTYTSWASNSPDGDCGSNTALYAHFHQTGPTWNDLSEDGVYCGQAPSCGVGRVCSFLIEWSADCNNDGIVDYGQVLNGQLADVNGDGVPDVCQAPLAGYVLVADSATEYSNTQGRSGWRYRYDRGAGTSVVDMAHFITSTGWCVTPVYGGTEDSTNASHAFLGAIAGHTNSADPCNTPAQGVLRPIREWTPQVGGQLLVTLQVSIAAATENGARFDLLVGDSVAWSTTLTSTSQQPVSDIIEVQGGQPIRLRVDGLDNCHADMFQSQLRIYASDCDGDLVPDATQIARSPALDANGDGRLDCCETGSGCCPADVTRNQVVDGVDLAAILGAWGTDGQNQYNCDIDNDGVVSGTDLAFVLGGWGPCP